VVMAVTNSRPKADKLCDADSRDGGAKPNMRAERLRGELLKLSIRVWKRTVPRYMKKRVPSDGQRWTTFLRNHVVWLVTSCRRSTCSSARSSSCSFSI
jgi:hypothetical protein